MVLSARGIGRLGLGRISRTDITSTLFYMRQSLVVGIADSAIVPAVVRGRVLRAARVRTAGSSLLYRGVVVQGPGRLNLGHGVFVNYGCYFDTVGDIEIGDGVFIADHVRILTSTHEVGPSSHRAWTLTGAPVRIGAGSWIGSGATILPGVTIGPGCVVGANSLVTKDCEADSVYFGSPAVKQRSLD